MFRVNLLEVKFLIIKYFRD